MRQLLRSGETTNRTLPWIDEAPTSRGFGNGLLAGVAAGREPGAFGQAVALDQLQGLGGLTQASRLFSSNARVQAAMAANASSPGALWAQVMGGELPAMLQALLDGVGAGAVRESEDLLGALLRDAEQAEALLGDAASLEAREPRDPAGQEGEITYGPFSEFDAFNFEFAPDPEELGVQAEARVRAGEDAPLRTAGSARPDESCLYELREPQGETDGWQAISGIVGSPERPDVVERVVPDALFIGDGPSVADVHQGSLGTCWFLAALIDLVVSDPDRIRMAFVSTGDVVKVRLFRRVEDTWAPVIIAVPNTFAQAANGEPVGAMPRVAEAPRWCDWFTFVTADDLYLRQRAWYEMAVWVPLLEKALASYAERYGTKPNEPYQDAGASGYDISGGGFLPDAANILLGPGAAHYVSGEAGPNEEVLVWLAALQARGMRDILASASCSWEAAVEGLKLQLAVDLPLLASWPAVQEVLRDLDAQLAVTVSPDRQVIQAAAVAALDALRAHGLEGRFAPLAEQIELVEGGSPLRGDGLVRKHAYAIVAVNLVDGTGARLTSGSADALARVDRRQSTVTLRNPWGRMEPLHQQGGAEGQEDGQFQLSVSQLMRLLPTVNVFEIPSS